MWSCDPIFRPRYTPPVPSPITPRLELRRLFLRAAIASLAIGGLIAVAALLLNQFNETTGRILGTLAALAFHCGIAIALLNNMDKGRAIPLMRMSLGLFGLSFAVLLTAIWMNRGSWIGEALATTGFLTGAHLLATPGGTILDRRAAPALGWAAIGLPAVALVLALIATWINSRDDMLIRAAATAGLAAFTSAQFALLYLMRATEVLRALYLAVLASAAFLALGISLLIWQPDAWALVVGEAAWRILGAVGVIDACSTLVLIVMARLRRTPAQAAVVGAITDIWLRCPRCSQEQDLPLGNSACCACALKITVSIEATNCAKCGYTLANLPSRLCPECGTPF